jgi:hypothetical protein
MSKLEISKLGQETPVMVFDVESIGHLAWKCCHCGSVKDSTAPCGGCGSSQATPIKVDGMDLIAARPFVRQAQKP